MPKLPNDCRSHRAVENRLSLAVKHLKPHFKFYPNLLFVGRLVFYILISIIKIQQIKKASRISPRNA